MNRTCIVLLLTLAAAAAEGDSLAPLTVDKIMRGHDLVGWEPRASRWEAERDGTRLRATWAPESRDEERGREVHRSTLEVLTGPRTGEVHEELHELTWWTPAGWGEAVAESPFTWAAVYDGNLPERPRVGFDSEGGLLWHELVRR